MLHFILLLSYIFNVFIFLKTPTCACLQTLWCTVLNAEKCHICCVILGHCRLYEYINSFHCASFSVLSLPTYLYPVNGHFPGELGLISFIVDD